MATSALKKRKFNAAQIESLIEDVRKHPMLYDKKDKDYKLTNMKTGLWRAVGAKYGMSGDQTIRKWQVQRDRYTKERRIVKDSLTNGGDVYTPAWHLYPLMDSVLGENAKRDNKSNMSDNMFDTPMDGSQVWEDGSPIESEGALDDYAQDRSAADGPCDGNSWTIPHSTDTLAMPSFKKSSSKTAAKNKSGNQTALHTFKSAAYRPQTVMINQLNSEPNQPVRLKQFCDYLCTRLSALDKKDQFNAINEIETLMTSKEGQAKYFEL